MPAAYREHVLRMEKHIAQFRLAAVAIAATVLLRDPQHLLKDWTVVGLAAVALVYGVAVALSEPYRHGRILRWGVASGFMDWGLITAWIILTGGIHSPFYLLYFLSILSIAMRYGLREVLIAAAGTVCGYLGIALATYGSPPALYDAALRMGHLLLFALGSGVLAREASRHFRARLKEEAQRLAVQEVTATISHDLKNPLSAIAGLLEILLDCPETLSLDQQALLHRINANTQQMANLVANLLDAELIECGRQPFYPMQTDINALARRVVEAQAHQAELKHIGLVLDLSPHLPPALLDGRLIERLLANLLNNAVKFTPENGAVRVSTAQRGARIVLEVWDSGPEVPAAMQGALFDKFVRQSDSAGSGLGLYICKSIVDMHRGTIFLRKPVSGVSFVVELPLAAAVRAHTPPQPGMAMHALSRVQLGTAHAKSGLAVHTGRWRS